MMAMTSQFVDCVCRYPSKTVGASLLNAGEAEAFDPALPTGLRARSLLFHRVIETGLIELNTLVTSGVDHEVEGKAKRIV